MNKIYNSEFIADLKKNHPDFSPTIQRILKEGKDHYHVLMYCVRNKRPISGKEACKLWSDHLGVAWVDLNKSLFQPSAVKKMPRELAKENAALPMYQLAGVITTAMADPVNYDLINKIENIVGAKISPVFALKDEILDMVDIQLRPDNEIGEISKGINPEIFAAGMEISKMELEKYASNKVITELVDAILFMAVRENATDIHIEPSEDQIILRYRVDGVLHEKSRLNRELLLPVVSRLKVLADMDITERRRPQDGRIGLELMTMTLNFRISTVPTVNGEKTVLRMLGQVNKKNIPQIEELSLSKTIYDWCQNIINSPNGAFFVTGPTGSGKTTTLFSALQQINTSEINIMTIEDPVEYKLPGTNQVQINHSIDLGFAPILKSFLRQDPDVMLIGEIRDLETARIATQAALTGHLVLASLHTNNAIQAVTRLVEIGVEPFLVGPSLLGIIAQRLVRRLCEKCKEKYTLSREKMDELFDWEGLSPLEIYRAKGCPDCNDTGYSGRIAIHEMIMINEDLRRMVVNNAPLENLEKEAVKSGYQPMRYDGIKKVIRGLTTLEEIERILPEY